MHVNASANKSLLWSCTFLESLAWKSPFIRTLLRFHWKRKSKASSNGALISLTFSVMKHSPPTTHTCTHARTHTHTSTSENKKGAPPKRRLCRTTLCLKQYDTEFRSTLGEPASTWAGKVHDGCTCARQAGRGNYSSGSYITSNMSEVLNVIYSGSSCWEEALKWV